MPFMFAIKCIIFGVEFGVNGIKKWGFGVKWDGFPERKNQKTELLSGATREASSSRVGGKLPRPALMFLSFWGT